MFFGVDLIIGTVAYSVVAACFSIFQIGYHNECDDLEGGETCTMSAIPNFAEWLGFIVTALSICIMYIAFWHDPKLYLQIKSWSVGQPSAN